MPQLNPSGITRAHHASNKLGSHLRVLHCGLVLADTTNALRVLETSHPPVYYIPPADIAMHVHPAIRAAR